MKKQIIKLFLVLMLIINVFIAKTEEVKADLTPGILVSYMDNKYLNYYYNVVTGQFEKVDIAGESGELELNGIPNLEIKLELVDGIPNATLILTDDITLCSVVGGPNSGSIIASRMPVHIIGNGHTLNFVCSQNPEPESSNDATAIESRNYIYIENVTFNFYEDLNENYFSKTSDEYEGIVIEPTIFTDENIYANAPCGLYIKNSTINSYGSSFINTNTLVDVTLDNTKANVIVGSPNPSDVKKASKIDSEAFDISEKLTLTNGSVIDVYAEYKNKNSNDDLLFEEDYRFEPIATAKSIIIEKNSTLKINNPRNNVLELLSVTDSIEISSSILDLTGGLIGIMVMSKGGGKDHLYLEEGNVNGREKEGEDALPRNIKFDNANVTMTNLLCNILYMSKRDVVFLDGEGITITKTLSNHEDVFKIIGIGQEYDNPLEEMFDIPIEQSFYLPDEDNYFHNSLKEPIHLVASLNPDADLSEYEPFDSSKINQYKAIGVLGTLEEEEEPEPEIKPEKQEKDHHHSSHNYLIPQTGIK